MKNYLNYFQYILGFIILDRDDKSPALRPYFQPSNQVKAGD
jgi:hypothetical protein